MEEETARSMRHNGKTAIDDTEAGRGAASPPPVATSASDKMYKMTGESIGKRAAAKSCGLFRADDWQCGKCRNVNWARRSLCNVCNAPKFVEVQRRTGVGGGYNEREEAVEYVRRSSLTDEDGEEYDEYGRRRRKRLRREKESGVSDGDDEVELDKVGYEGVVDEESEDEVVDLSKYDLIDWKDDEVAKKSLKEN